MHPSILLAFLAPALIYSLSCRISSKKFPYYVGINFPTTVRNDASFAIFTSDSKKFTLNKELIDSSNSIFESTLAQLNTKGIQFIAWNDDSPLTNQSSASTRAHAKGVIGVDPVTKTGFYFGHSFPNFPNINDNDIDHHVPKSADIYGQTFFCISMKTDELEQLAKTISISKPNVYFDNINADQFPNLANLAKLPALRGAKDDPKKQDLNVCESKDKVFFCFFFNLKLSRLQYTVKMGREAPFSKMF